jgi:hypothetical protein
LIQKKKITTLLIAFLILSTLSAAITTTAKAETTITFTFASSNFSTGDTVTCIAKVTGQNLSGNVTWAVNENLGMFSSAQADLSNGIFTVIFSGSSFYTRTITATYSGDSTNPSCTYSRDFDPQSSLYIIPVGGYIGNASIYTIPTDIPVTLEATVLGNSPTGTINWSTSSPTGVFSSTQAFLGTIVSGTYGQSAATVVYSDSTLGQVTITASYNGDSTNNPYKISTNFSIIPVDHQLILKSAKDVPKRAIITFQSIYSGYDVTQDTTWSINPPTGTWLASNRLATNETGKFTITANYHGTTNQTSIWVYENQHGEPVSLSIKPVLSILSGSAQRFTATAQGTDGHVWDVSSVVEWSINNEAGGHWTNNIYTSTNPGNWTVTATIAGLQASTNLMVFDPKGYPIVTVAQAGAKISNLKVANGTQFKVDLSIDNATQLFGYRMFVKWDPAVLKLTQVTAGSFLSQTGQTLFLVQVDPNNIGYIPMGISAALLVTDEANGSGVLATLTFQAIGNGNSDLTIDFGSALAGYVNFDLEYPNYRYIPFKANSGTVTVLSPDNLSSIDYIHDGKVNFDDLLYFANAYTHFQQNPNIDPGCDLNHDNNMNFDDILQFSNDWQTAHS